MRRTAAGRRGALPGATAAAWVNAWSWTPWLVLMTLVPLYFPDDRLPSPRWRWVARSSVVAVVTATVARMLAPVPIDAAPTLLANPLGLDGAPWINGVVVLALAAGFGACGPAALASLVVRFRRASGATRAQVQLLGRDHESDDGVPPREGEQAEQRAREQQPAEHAAGSARDQDRPDSRVDDRADQLPDPQRCVDRGPVDPAQVHPRRRHHAHGRCHGERQRHRRCPHLEARSCGDDGRRRHGLNDRPHRAPLATAAGPGTPADLEAYGSFADDALWTADCLPRTRS